MQDKWKRCSKNIGYYDSAKELIDQFNASSSRIMDGDDEFTCEAISSEPVKEDAEIDHDTMEFREIDFNDACFEQIEADYDDILDL